MTLSRMFFFFFIALSSRIFLIFHFYRERRHFDKINEIQHEGLAMEFKEMSPHKDISSLSVQEKKEGFHIHHRNTLFLTFSAFLFSLSLYY